MLTAIEPFLPQIPLLIVFLGMFALVWRSLSIAHDLSSLALKPPQPAPPALPQSVPAQPHSVPPSVTAPSQTQPAAEAAVVDAGLVAYIKRTEGFSAKAYWDYKQWTNGYGTKATSATEVVDEATATARLTAEIAAAYNAVNKFHPGLPKGPAQALTDPTFNAGAGWEEGSLGAAVKAEKWDTVKADILLYNHAGGQVLPGLTKRREDEVSWFDNPL